MEASTGAEGISSARRHKPDLIFLDLAMPDMDGFEVLERLKGEPLVAATPVVVVTSRDLTARDRSLLLQSASAIVDKGSLEATDFMDVIREASWWKPIQGVNVAKENEMPMSSILNVDDYGPGRYARTRVLQRAGFNVREASTGSEALALAFEFAPPIILLDVNLPDMSGFEVCKRIKRDPRTGTTTILHISATNVETHHLVQGLDCGADSYLVEPVDPNVLIATINAFLRARRAEDALRRSNEELERFAYRVAHDLSEPLRTISSHTTLLEKARASNWTSGRLRTFTLWSTLRQGCACLLMGS